MCSPWLFTRTDYETGRKNKIRHMVGGLGSQDSESAGRKDEPQGHKRPSGK